MRSKTWLRPSREGWDPLSYERYFATVLGSTIRSREEKAVHGFLGALMRPGHAVLEVGSGTGNYTVPVARRCARMVAVDQSPEMLGYLRERLRRESLTNVETRSGRLPEGLGAAERFDGVLAVGVLNYVEDLEGALRALASVLKPGGWAVFNAPLTTIEGRIYALTELANRRRICINPHEEIVASARRAGLRAEATTPAGLSRGGLSLVVGAVAEPPTGGCTTSPHAT